MSAEAKKLVVLGIPLDVDTEGLRQYMSLFGELADVMVMKDRVSGRSRGFGYVTFAFGEDAEEEMMPTSRASARVFVARIPTSVTDGYFHSYFLKYGPIIDAYMPKDPVTKQHRGIGFVTYEIPDSVDLLMSETHELNGSAVIVDRATPKGGCRGFKVSSRYFRMPQTSRTANTVDYNPIYCNSRMVVDESQSNQLTSSVQSAAVSMFAGDAHSAIACNGEGSDPHSVRSGKRLFIGRVPPETTSADLHSYFGQFGWVLDVYLPKDVKKTSHRGFGFVTFVDEASAARVLRRRHFLHGREIAIDAASPADKVHVTGQIPITQPPPYGSREDLSQDLMIGADSGDDRSAWPSFGSHVKWGKRLFIGRIPIEATVADLQLHFRQFGHVVDVYLPKDDTKTTHRGFGFVTFVDEFSAEYASQKLHTILGQQIVLDTAAPLPNDCRSAGSTIFPRALDGSVQVGQNLPSDQLYYSKFSEAPGAYTNRSIRTTLRYRPY